uniref:hypothetical protein n=1 Tax=Acetatifactor sp. TaxID=1872090 RepID=UPI0040562F78
MANLILIIAVTRVVKERGASSVARLGIWTACFYIGTMVGTVVLSILFIVLAFMDFSGALWMLVAILALAITSLVLYLKFLLNSAEQLGTSV